MLVIINRTVQDEPANPNRRTRMKFDRRSQLLAAAERLIAQRGYTSVRLEDIGAAAGVSGPAIYRHFSNKEALLVELLVEISARLLAGGTSVVSAAPDASAALAGLVEFHLDFALAEADLIRIQDRDLSQLPAPALRKVRQAQRQYVEVWVDVLRQLHQRLTEADARLMAHAAFGLMNSTPHSVRSPTKSARATLRAMTLSALTPTLHTPTVPTPTMPAH